MLASKAGAEHTSPFETAPAGLILGDYFVSYSDIDGIKIRPYSAEALAIHALDYELTPNVISYWESDGDEGSPPSHPRVFLDLFLKRSLTRPLEEEEVQEELDNEIQAKIETICEWIGLALLGVCTMEATALVIHGSGSNGKSVLTSMISDLFGGERTCHLPPQAMSERFSRAQLFGAAVNVVSEMPEADLLASDTLKAVISGDKIEVERKHRDPFSFRPRAAHVFAANNLPSSRDRSHGLWRRLVPVQFCHEFSEADKDRQLLNKLREEYALIVPYCLDRAREYFRRGGYAHQQEIEKWRMDWRSDVDSVAAFARDLCEICEPKEGLQTIEIWREFVAYCEDRGQSGGAKMSQNKLIRQLSALPSVRKTRRRINGSRCYVLNLKLIKQRDLNAWPTARGAS